MVPVLVLLTVFVLWAGRGGRAALTADLAAEEAVTAAALCCDEGDLAGGGDREALVEDMLDARPGLGFLCIGGPRPNAGDGSEGFLSERWVEFEPGREVGGVGVLGVQFLCESDGAVAPLRGLFPTVTFHGQAAEVVQREPRFIAGFEPTRVEVVEGTDSELVFTVRVQPAQSQEVTLSFEVDPATTAGPEDFGGTDFAGLLGLSDAGVGTVVIPANAGSAQMPPLALVDDGFFEGDEQLVLRLTGADVVLDDDRIRAVGVIKDNDPEPLLQIIKVAAEVAEGGDGTPGSEYLEFVVRVGDESGVEVADIAAPFTVRVSTLDDAGGRGDVCDWPLSDGVCPWATADQDYVPVERTLNFAPGGLLSVPVRVGTLDDESSPEGEPTEYVRLVLSEPVLSDPSAVAPAVAPRLHTERGTADGAIFDDEAEVSVRDVTAVGVAEGNPVEFRVTLDRGPAADVTLDYTLGPDLVGAHQGTQAAGSSCTDGDDYVGAAGQVVIAAFSLEATFEVQTCGDVLVEHHETFWVGLSRATDGGEVVVPENTGTRGTIRNDDIPVVSIVADPSDATGVEGQTLEFAVSVTVNDQPAQLSENIFVDYTIGGYGPNPATAPAPDAPDADFAVRLGTAPPTVLSGTLEFTAATPGVAAVTEHVFEAELIADYLVEVDETFVVDLDNLDDPVRAAVFEDTDDDPDTDDSFAVGTIEDDAPPVLSVSGFRGREDSDQSFTVSLAGARSGDEVSVGYEITGGTGAGDATEGVDYEAAPGSALSGTLIFPDDTAPRTVGVRLLADTVREVPETLRLTLRDPVMAVLFDHDAVADGVQAYAEGTIDDFDPPYLFVGNTEAREGVPLMFTVALCNPVSGQEVTVKYETVERSAKEGLAFLEAADTLTFPADMRSEEVTKGECGVGVTADAKLLPVVVQTLRDGVEESDQEVHLVLSGQTPADHVGLGKSIGVGRIINVSAATVRVSDPVAVEGDPLGFTISLVDNDGDPAVITEDVTVFYATADRTATAGADYTPVPATPGPCLPGTAPPPSCPSVTFDHTGTVRHHQVRVLTTADTEDEDDETVALVLSLAAGTVNAGLGDTEGTGTIIDADPPELRIADADAEEGQTMTFEVTLVDSNGVETSTSEVVTVFAATEDGTAHAGADYTAESRLLTIPAGDTRVRVPFEFEVATSLDDINEPPETFGVVLSGAGNAKIDRAVAVGTINPRCVDASLDDDNNRPPTITLHDTTAVEGSSYSVLVTFSAPMCEAPQIVRQQISGEGLGTATCGVDFHVGLGPCDPPAEVTGRLIQAITTVPRAQAGGWRIEADSLDEDDEWFTHRWRWGPDMPAHYQWPGPGLGWVSARVTILDDDPLPRLSVADASADEGDAVAFSISLDRASGRPVTVRYQTVAVTATGGTDYTEVDDTHTFVPGATFVTVYVPTVDDGAGDSGETFLFEVGAPPDPSTPMNAEIVDGVAVGTILEGNLPEMRIYDASADEDTTMLDTTMFLRVELSEAAARTVTVDYSTVERSGPRAAAEGVDYQPVVRQQLEFAPGDTVKFAEVIVNTDTDPEAAETFLVELADPSGAELADPSAVGTINSDVTCYDSTEPGAAAPRVTVDSPTAVEGNGQITFTVQLSEPICDDRAVFSIYPAGIFYDNFGSALPNVDFHYPAGSQGWKTTVAALATEASFTVVLIDDDIDEPDEDIRMSVRSASYLEHVEAVGTIVDDDQAALSVAGDSGPEGGFLNFVIRLDGPSDRTVTVDYATEDATPPSAEAGTDYRARSDTAVIAAGDLSATVAVFAPQDRLDEDAETFQLRLINPTGGASLADADAVATGTITDDDVPPSLRVSDASVDEGGTLVFVVTLDAPSGREVSVPVATRDGSARAADGDYVGLASSVVVFAPGVTRQTVSVRTLADDVVEGAEFVWLDLGPVGDGTATIGDDTGRGVIRDVSDRRVSVSDADVVEGGTLAFEVGFAEGASGRDVTVRYRTRAGTAAAGGDYDGGFESVSRELRIVAGDTSATVSVPTVPDILDEDNESLELVLSDPAGAVIVAGSASGTIIDDDPLPELRVSNTEASEGVGASAAFTLSLGEASGRDVTVAYRTEDGTAVAGDDYIAVSDGEVVIAAGHRQATVDVALVDDDVAEDVETFRLVVSSAVNAGRGDSVGVATVTDDDGLVQILVDDPAAVHEGDGASAVFTVRLSHAHPTEAVTVMYSTADGTAIAGSDYTAATSQTLTFAVTDTIKTVSVPLINDDVAEPAETFGLVLSSPSSNAELGDGEATVLIRDDDGLPTVSVTDAATRTEGATASFTVTLSRAVPQEVTVDYATRPDLTAAAETAAVPGQDYTTTSGTVTFAARATEATVTVPLLGDALDEHTETFWLRLASPVGATIVDGTATGTIADDDPLPEITIADAAATEGAPVSFEVRLTPFSGRTVTVPWTTEARPPGAGAASPGSDYTAATGTLTLAPGTTTARVEVATLPDDVSEADETFLVQLGTPANAALDDSTASGVIFDDDGLPRVFIADTTVNEDDGPAIFTVTLSHPSSQPVTVEYNTADGTAEDPDDYAPDLVRTLTIPATFTGGEISVFIADDDEGEGTETFTITLTDPVNAVIAEGAGTAVGYIVDDEGQPRLTVADAAECECAVDGTLDFPVTLSAASSGPVTVRYTTFDGDAASPGDYVATTATLTIPAGDESASIPVVLVDDGVAETGAETFRLRLDNPVGVELAVAEAIGTIFDDEPVPLVSAQAFSAFANENDGFAYHRVTLSHPSDLTVTVDYSFDHVVDRSRFTNVDNTPGTLTFAPGVLEQTIEVPLYDNGVATYSSGGWSYTNAFYWISLSNRVNAIGGIDSFRSAIGYVWDDETPPYVDSVTGHDILEGAGAATFTITLNRFSDTAVTATYRTADGTAAAGSDYSAVEATVTFPPGTITAAVTVPITDDTEVENDESFTLEIIDDRRNSNLLFLANPRVDGRGYGAETVVSTVLIIDDDTMPEISVADIAANENAGAMTFWVSLSRASATDVTVDYATADGTATAGSDYAATNDTLTILAGDTGAPVSVTIIDDTDDTESDETFELNLSNAAGATITNGSATATIIEDANLPIITVRDASSIEGRNTGNRMPIPVDIDRPATRIIRVDYQLVEVPSLGDEAATVGADLWETDASGFVGIAEGFLSTAIGVLIIDDVIPERDERFLVILSNPQGARLGDSRAWATILNDDVPIVTVADVEASESDDDAAVVFTLQLHEPGLDPASLDYTTVVRSSEGESAASPGEDFTTASGTLNIPAGDTTATISVPIIADTADEADETFLLVLSNPDTLEFRDRVAVGTIVDDDPGFWIEDDRSVRENAGSMVFTVQRDHTSTADVAVEYRFGSGGSAVGGADCTVDGVDFEWPSGTSASGTVTMPAAGTEAAISVEVCNDDDPEGRENLLIELTNVTGRKLTGVGTIVDDDRTDLPRINIYNSDLRGENLHDALGGARFQITADGPLTDTVTVTWRTEDCLATDTECPDPATAGDDYTAAGGTVTLTPDDLSAFVTVTVLDDTIDEPSEAFFVRITGVTGPAAVGSGVTHTDPVGIGFILNDD